MRDIVVVIKRILLPCKRVRVTRITNKKSHPKRCRVFPPCYSGVFHLRDMADSYCTGNQDTVRNKWLFLKQHLFVSKISVHSGIVENMDKIHDDYPESSYTSEYINFNISARWL